MKTVRTKFQIVNWSINIRNRKWAGNKGFRDKDEDITIKSLNCSFTVGSVKIRWQLDELWWQN